MGNLPDTLSPEQAQALGLIPKVAPTPPPSPTDVPDPASFATKLSPGETQKFEIWRKTLPPRLQSDRDYDLRGFWRKNPTFSVDQPGQHMTDEFKLPNHDTFSNESRYYNDKTKHLGGSWQDGPNGGAIYTPNDTRFKRRIVEDANGERVEEAAASKPSAAAALPDTLTPEQAQKLGLIPTAKGPEAPPAPSRSFLDRVGDTAAGLANTFAGGAQAVGESVRHPIDTITDPARRRQLERGLDDMMTLGYGQKLAARVGNALGDTPERALGPETFGGGVRGAGGAPVANTQSADQAAAPEYRHLGNVLGMFGPGATSALAGGGAKLVKLGLGGVKAATPLSAAALGTARGVLGYEASAPLSAALAASSEGRRWEAAKEAATDPVGLALAGGGGALAEGGASAVNKSKGVAARKLIEEKGQGATVGVKSAGSGGVFDRELAGVPASDKGIGEAAKRGAINIADTIEQQFEQKHGFGYREGKDVNKAASAEADTARKLAIEESKAARLRYRDDLSAAADAVKTETAQRARQILDHIDEEHAVETSKPYRVLKAMIDNSPAAVRPRDVTPIVTAMQDAAHDLETAPFVRSQLNEQLNILDRYRDPQTGAVMVPERQLNGLRRTLMRSAKIGMSDAPGEAEAPLRRAAYEAKRMVDEGPYKALNDLYAEGSAKREASRKAVGLPGKPSKSAASDEKRLVSTLRRSVDDQTAIPGPLPPEADVSHLRSALKAPENARDAAMARLRASLADADTKREQIASHVAAAEKDAIPDRAALGLNSKIGTRKTDVNQIMLALKRQGDNSVTGGGNPSDLAAFRAAHPEMALNLDLPEIQRAKADLSFRLLPHHGGMIRRLAGASVGPAAMAGMHYLAHTPLAWAVPPLALGAMNAAPIAGRLLYPLAQKADAGGLGATVARALAAQREGREGR